jgi:hypothetical protein
MRPAEEKIRQAILHPGDEIRAQALSYFTEGHTLDPTLMPLVIQAIEQYGRDISFRILRLASSLPQTEATVEWLIRELHRPYDLEDIDQDNYRFAIALALEKAEPALIRPRQQEIVAAPAFPERLIADFTRRLVLAESDWGTCREELVRFVEERSDRNLTILELRHAHDLVVALHWHSTGHEAEVLSLLEAGLPNESADVNLAIEPFIVRLAGRMRLEAAIGLLIEKLYEGRNWLSDACVDALARVGTDQVVQTIVDKFPTSNEDFRAYALGPIEQIHSEYSIRRCLELFAQEQDPESKERLAAALLGQFAEEGLETVREFLLPRKGTETPDIRDMRYNLVAVSTVLDWPFPEYDDWHAEAQRNNWGHPPESRISEQYFLDRTPEQAILEILLGNRIDLMGALEDRLSNVDDYEDYDEYEYDDAEEEEFRPAPRAQRKPGRNEPCPCGSGRKYKHCCLKKERR